jgi:hypothetical protein
MCCKIEAKATAAVKDLLESRNISSAFKVLTLRGTGQTARDFQYGPGIFTVPVFSYNQDNPRGIHVWIRRTGSYPRQQKQGLCVFIRCWVDPVDLIGASPMHFHLYECVFRRIVITVEDWVSAFGTLPGKFAVNENETQFEGSLCGMRSRKPTQQLSAVLS